MKPGAKICPRRTLEEAKPYLLEARPSRNARASKGAALRAALTLNTAERAS